MKKSTLRYFVVLDDLDRLEPNQAIEVIRLVKSVADFPNILYLMCYDRDVLANAIKKGLGVQDGYLFLQKIIQQTFSIPLPEPFDLRLNFTTHAIKFFELTNKKIATTEEIESIENAVSEWGIDLRTPRKVKLSLNSVKFHYTPVKNEVNFSDVCRIQLIKTLNPAMYRWLEKYLGVMSIIATGDGRSVKKEREIMGKKHEKLFSADPDSTYSRLTVKKLVPGLNALSSKDPSGLIYGTISQQQLQEFVDGKRLGSPFHSRYYFAFSPARTVLTEQEYQTALDAALQDSNHVTNVLTSFYDRPRSVGGNWLSQFFNRLESSTRSELNTTQIENLIMGIANLMEEVLQRQALTHELFSGTARRAEVILGHLARNLACIGIEKAHDAIFNLIKSSTSVTWVIGYFLRREIHRHKTKKTTDDDWLLSSSALSHGIKIAQTRVTNYSKNINIEDSPDLYSLLFGWMNLGIKAKAQAIAWVQTRIQSDEGLLEFLLRMRSWVISDEIYFPLHKKTLEPFIKTDLLDEKLEKLLTHKDPSLRGKAETVISALKLSSHF